MSKPELERLEALKKQAEQLKARIAKIEAKQSAQTRKEDTRLKVVVGAALLADAKTCTETAAVIRAVLTRTVSAQRDKDFLKAKNGL
jgi:hypothetical protein